MALTQDIVCAANNNDAVGSAGQLLQQPVLLDINRNVLLERRGWHGVKAVADMDGVDRDGAGFFKLAHIGF